MFETAETNQDAAPDTSSDAGQSEVDNQVEDSQDESFLNSDDSGHQEEQQQEEEDDVEVGGKQYKLPKSAAEILKSERMMHSDYTQKTQSVAEQKRAFEQQQQDSHKYIQDIAKVVSIDNQLAEYHKLDWQSLIANDPVQAMQLQQQQRTLEFERNQAANEVAHKKNQNALNEQQETAKRIQDADTYLKREIAGWSPERSDQLLKYGVAKGMDERALKDAVLRSPAIAVALNKAELYDQIVSKQKPAAPVIAQAKPVAKVGGNASVKADPSKMTDKQFAEYRRKISTRR